MIYTFSSGRFYCIPQNLFLILIETRMSFYAGDHLYKEGHDGGLSLTKCYPVPFINSFDEVLDMRHWTEVTPCMVGGLQ